MPQRVQPGPLAASMSFSAPISLGFFFLVIFVLATLRGIDIHPINYALIGASFPLPAHGSRGRQTLSPGVTHGFHKFYARMVDASAATV